MTICNTDGWILVPGGGTRLELYQTQMFQSDGSVCLIKKSCVVLGDLVMAGVCCCQRLSITSVPLLTTFMLKSLTCPFQGWQRQ